MRYEFLTRTHRTPDGVFGKMMGFTSVEEQDLGNQPRISCFPEGAYVCRRKMYNKGGYETFEITDVPNRSNILFHVINTEEDTEGCVGITTRLGVMERIDEDTGIKRHKLAGVSSRSAFKEFMDRMAGVHEFVLVVRWLDT